MALPAYLIGCAKKAERTSNTTSSRGLVSARMRNNDKAGVSGLCKVTLGQGRNCDLSQAAFLKGTWVAPNSAPLRIEEPMASAAAMVEPEPHVGC